MTLLLDDFYRVYRPPAREVLAFYLPEAEQLLWAGYQKKSSNQAVGSLVGFGVALFWGLAFGWWIHSDPNFPMGTAIVLLLVPLVIGLYAARRLYRYRRWRTPVVYGLSATHLWVLLPWRKAVQSHPLAQLRAVVVPSAFGTFSIRKASLYSVVRDAEGDHNTAAFVRQILAAAK